MKRPWVVAIDGPAAAGKSSVAAGLAKRLGAVYLDSGSLYRGLAWRVIEEKVDPNQQPDVVSFCRSVQIELRLINGKAQIWADQKEITPYLRFPDVSRVSAIISAYAGVRAHLLALQLKIASGSNVVVEGRDIGTVVFPDAEVKFYLDASVEIRGMRRFKELQARGMATDLETTIREIISRDGKDSHRAVAPLRIADDAIFIDSTQLGLEEVIERMAKGVTRKVGMNPTKDLSNDGI